jgi:tripeptidyl-peptidase-1
MKCLSFFMSSFYIVGNNIHQKAHLAGRSDILPGARVHPHEVHAVTFSVKKTNVDMLEQIFLNVSDPFSAEYGKHWTKAKISELTANPLAVQKISSYLKSHGMDIVSQTSDGSYITVQGKVSAWEKMFSTKFFEFKHKHWNNEKINRALEYSLPQELNGHVEYVFEIVDFPLPNKGSPIVKPSIAQKTPAHGISAQAIIYTGGEMTPAVLKAAYGIMNSTGSSLTSQAVFSTTGQTFSPTDLSAFQTAYSLPQQSIAGFVGEGHVRNDACTYMSEGIEYCQEVNLEMQYLMSTAQSVPTTSYYTDNSLLKWIKDVSDMTNPPKVFTISYGYPELYVSTYYINAFNAEAMKLGLMGVTLLAAAGDDGAPGYDVRDGDLTCGYYPIFPATSPYVTAVGATQVNTGFCQMHIILYKLK